MICFKVFLNGLEIVETSDLTLVPTFRKSRYMPPFWSKLNPDTFLFFLNMPFEVNKINTDFFDFRRAPKNSKWAENLPPPQLVHLY